MECLERVSWMLMYLCMIVGMAFIFFGGYLVATDSTRWMPKRSFGYGLILLMLGMALCIFWGMTTK
jgi:hypothetical protein